jgi:multimeric flavodoxin WrbA
MGLMKVLAINGSPHKDEGNTAMILGPFLEGMKEEGCDVDVLFVKDLDIKPCNADMSCWFANPGTCYQLDDMQMVLPMIMEADVIVWASPVYYSGMTGPLKNFMDRQLPLFMLRDKAKRQKVVLVSTCGAWELSMFDPLIVQMKALYGNPEEGYEFAGALLRPMADSMREMIKAGETAMIDRVFLAAKKAGSQLAKEGRISEELSQQVSRELMPRDAYYRAMELTLDQIKKAAGKSP